MITPEHINEQYQNRLFNEICEILYPKTPIRLNGAVWSILKRDALSVWNSDNLIVSREMRQEACVNLYKIWMEINEILFSLQDPKKIRVNVITKSAGKNSSYKEVEFYFDNEWCFSKIFSDSQYLEQIYIELMDRYSYPPIEDLDKYIEIRKRDKQLKKLLTEDVEV